MPAEPALLIGSSTAMIPASALRSIVLASIAAASLKTFGVRSARLRVSAWRVVLCAALTMPLLSSLLPEIPFRLPVVYQSHPSPAKEEALPSKEPLRSTNDDAAAAGASRSVAASDAWSTSRVSPPHSIPTVVHWGVVAGVLYVVIVCLFLARVLLGLLLARRITRTSHAIRELRTLAMVASHANAFGLRSPPRLAESEALSVPVTFGWFSPSILLPAGWRSLHEAALDAVIAHEMSHVARRDSLIDQLSLLHRSLFWFSPLSWWLHKHLSDLAEEVSDAAALRTGIDRRRYAETLLGFFTAVRNAHGRVWWQGVAMAKSGSAEQRVSRILAWSSATSFEIRKSRVAGLALFAITLVYIVAAARLVTQAAPRPLTQGVARPVTQAAVPFTSVHILSPQQVTPRLQVPERFVVPASAPALETDRSVSSVYGIYTDGNSFTDGIDRVGFAYSANLLGESQTWDGTTFTFQPANIPDAYTSTTIPLPPGRYSTLKMLATGVEGNQTSQAFTVTYTDGTTTTFIQSISDWYTPQDYSGESKAVIMPYRNTSGGERDDRMFYLYGYSFSLNRGKAVKSLTLPDNRNVVVLAVAPSDVPTKANLVPAFNSSAIYTDGSSFTDGIDGVGYGYSANLLGESQTWDGTTFTFQPANVPDAYTSTTIPLPPGRYSTLKMLATGVEGNQTSQAFTVTYMDGTTTTFTQSLSDWYTPQHYSGESKAVIMPYRNMSGGERDDRTFYLYGYSFSLNRSKVVKSLTLPDNRNVVVLGVVPQRRPDHG